MKIYLIIQLRLTRVGSAKLMRFLLFLNYIFLAIFRRIFCVGDFLRFFLFYFRYIVTASLSSFNPVYIVVSQRVVFSLTY